MVALQRFFQCGAHQVGYAFRGFQRHVAHEAVGDDDIHVAAVEVAAFHIADKIQRKLLQQRISFAGKFVALGFFFADGKQADARAAGAEHAAKIGFAHDRELLEVVRLAIDVGADVEQNGHRAQRRWEKLRPARDGPLQG